MKIKSLLLCIAIGGTCYSQTINNFNSADLSVFAVVTATLDQSASGSNATWAFNNLVATGNTNSDIHSVPTAGEIGTYPGTTLALTITELPSMATTKVFTKNITNEVSITGAEGTDFSLNYLTDNALIGTFPLSVGYLNIDPVSGTFTSTSANGTFTGTIETNVDAFGTLTMNDVGSGSAYSGNITRLKTTQNLNLTISGFLPGTITLTSYNYYANNTDLVLRTSDILISIPFLGINQPTSTKESLLTSVLATTRDQFTYNNLKIVPNPVGEQLHIKMNNTIKSIFITDMTGRIVLRADGTNTSVPVNHLISGIYFATITTDSGITTQKFIKR